VPHELRRQVTHLVRTLRWFGWSRILTVVIAVPLVGWGAYFLLRSPGPPVEASLAYATTVPLSVAGTSPDAVGENSASPPALVTVHVAGHVFSPGVYRFSPGVRVVDAVRAAGGATQDADLNAINLAGPLDDGQQIYVPAFGERTPGSAASGSAGETAGPSPQLPINLNRATTEELDILPGIGPTTASAIVVFREQNGPFATVEGLLEVPGIGPAKLAALVGLITV
jgi:competence protein ComEA